MLGLSAVESEVNPVSGRAVDGSGNELILEIRNRSSAETEFSIGLARLEIEDESDTGYQMESSAEIPRASSFC